MATAQRSKLGSHRPVLFWLPGLSRSATYIYSLFLIFPLLLPCSLFSMGIPWLYKVVSGWRGKVRLSLLVLISIYIICFMHILCCIAVKSRSAPILRCSNFRDWSTIILILDTVNLLFKGKVQPQINILSLILTLMMFQTCKTFVHLWNTNEVNTTEVFYFIKSESSLVLYRQQGYYHGQCTER